MAYIRSLGLNPAALRDRVEQLGRSAQGKQRLAAETFVRQVDNPRAEPG
jgi:hypothetical protein